MRERSLLDIRKETTVLVWMGENGLSEVAKALELADSILEKITDLPERAEEFGDSVESKVISISETIESRNHVTPAQMNALENMLAGVERWIR